MSLRNSGIPSILIFFCSISISSILISAFCKNFITLSFLPSLQKFAVKSAGKPSTPINEMLLENQSKTGINCSLFSCTAVDKNNEFSLVALFQSCFSPKKLELNDQSYCDNFSFHSL